MTYLSILLGIIIALLFSIDSKLGSISARLKEKFPTEKEQDYELSQRDPMGHWEAHKNDKAKEPR